MSRLSTLPTRPEESLAPEAPPANADPHREIEQLIGRQMGLRIRPQERAEFVDSVALRVKVLGLATTAEYVSMLAADTQASRDEWKQLALALTNSESYFFRDRGQHELLRHRLLPELIHRNRRRRTLRIWSAGCSTGEEPYSLAMMVCELLPDLAGWDVAIMGTDVNEESLRKAREAIYAAWSFRAMESSVRSRYFKPCDDCWALNDEVRRLVSLGQCNLINDPIPNPAVNLRDFDLILCRNVFIYFGRSGIERVVAKFERALCAGGYLMTGHTELHGLDLPLRTLTFSQSIVYQKFGPTTSALRVNPPKQFMRRTMPNTTARPTPAKTTKTALSSSPSRAAADDFESLLSEAQASADVGHHEQAAQNLEAATALRPFAAEPHYLMAHIALDRGEVARARELLRRVIYLDPGFVAAYLQLATLCDSCRQAERGRKMRRTALALLRRAPPDTMVPWSDGATAGELAAQLARALGEQS